MIRRNRTGGWQNLNLVLSAVLPSMFAVLSAEPIGDPESSRRVYATVVIFVALGVAMSVLAIWLFRQTRPEPQLLAPLEIMDSRRWRRSEPGERRRELDAKRPPGARPLRRSVGRPRVDSEFDTAQPVRSFDDLVGDDDQASDLPEDGGSEQSRSADATDPTPVKPSRFDFSLVDELLTSGPDQSDAADAHDSAADLVGEETSETELLEAAAPDADADADADAEL
jgi:hypothetical protein